ncbi:hypothetical protein H310_09740 [Aphanomyces invadans]|uniref:Tc1-like transposase DDE domain-containing protein n=1 Tax=Aphanomyces invadans TaxID=157072 RepID=A0A024TTF8_9STRA|nr:hypothetical protein H310_09740 [Aphanomyces invadans]ETV97410.1 hypothetical protein H310_09740 [Aphanomyces invadans]|eukprot:XP_008874118.1 hypothetical protein H310_09740 [Aphanomyces invadans]
MFGVPFTNETKAELWKKLKVHVDKIDIEVVAMAKAAGHQVAYTPPYHSDLQPIETVGRQYTQETTFQDVRLRLVEDFDELKPSSIKGCIHKADRQLERLAQYIKDQEDNDDDSDSDASSDSSDDSSGSASD